MQAEFYADLCAVFGRKVPAGTGAHVYDPRLLAQMGLPPQTGQTEIKSRFSSLAKELHPDCGGDEDPFIRLVEAYRKLMAWSERVWVLPGLILYDINTVLFLGAAAEVKVSQILY
ncbi:J domain-containing protein [Fumia xinanensis]|uniref:J domain-containing protein n=1 Tax=Fumia xinanensis TaxID=2763659 RepID=A0A926E656_9FIRM|nr:J domain-containing protein [Fumia xinanensis]MBC8560255.1 J domain-containing protein [Fumia xinanensis]